MDVLLQAHLKLFHILEFVQVEVLRFERSKEAFNWCSGTNGELGCTHLIPRKESR